MPLHTNPEMKIFSGNAHPALARDICSYLGTELGNATPKVSFASVLKNGLDSVSALQTKASETAMAFQRGTPGVELPQVMLDMQKSSIAFRGAVEVRNRMISAYQDIMNMPV